MVVIGKKYNKLTAIRRLDKDKHGRYKYLFKCDCGNEKIIVGSYVKTGHTKSCGCSHKDAAKKRIKILPIGSKYGRLTILEHLRHENKHHVYLCKCDCGNIIEVYGCHLQSGHTKSCGCYNIEILKERMTIHGLKNEPLYIIWKGIKGRCYNKNSYNFKYYGGRGIKVCEEWKNDFVPFYNWAIENGYEYIDEYKNKLTLDRIDVDGNYEPNNCRWVEWKTQNNNRRKI